MPGLNLIHLSKNHLIVKDSLFRYSEFRVKNIVFSISLISGKLLL